ncbi:MAG: geranylgeranylglycerol-phosphate geranylgeranyltransferase [Bacteroidota bacterium]
MAWLQLVRWKNLLIIFLAQLLAWACVIRPQVYSYLPDSVYHLSAVNFLLLALSTMLIAAAGYIINDYFDVKIDLINKPERVVLGKTIARKNAILAHGILSILAIAIAGYVAAKAHHLEWLGIQVACVALLWLYSTRFKRQYVAGNLVVALLTSLTIVTLIVYEPAMHHPILPVWVLGTYAYFAFMLTWMREIVKDMEDHRGDEADGCVTMPIKKGLRFAMVFTIVLALLVIIPLSVAPVLLYKYNYKLLAVYIAVMLAVPLIVWVVAFGRGRDTRHYHNASSWLKMIMLAGICSLIIYYFQMLTNRV